MKKTTTIHEKIAVRACYAWQNGSTGGAKADWLAAEQIYQAYAGRRAVAARKAAETRKAKRSLSDLPIVTGAAAAKCHPTVRFPTATDAA